ncbi:MAG: oligosaccharide flippase family protein, partial [Thermoplasmata archaeon]|nr:oligosaccharide flippase family protein [Thermoplasmata archaeon]
MAVEGAAVRDGLSVVTRGTVLMLVGTIGFVVESFVSRVILVRVLTTTQWSEFSLGLALAGLLSVFGSLGLPSAVARNLPFASTDTERRDIVRTAFIVVLPAGLALSALMFLLGLPISSTFHAPLLGLTLEAFSIAVGLSIVAGLIASVFQGYEDVLPNALFVQVLNPLLFIAFLIVAAEKGPLSLSYSNALLAYVAASVVTIVSLTLYTRSRLPRHLPSGPRSPGLSRKLLLFAAPLFAAGILGYLTGTGDTIVLGAWHLSEVGYYTAGLSLARLLQVGIGSLAYIFLPVTARFVRQGDRASVRLTYTTATKWVLLTSLPLFFVFFFLPTPSLNFVYGSGYATSTLALRVVVLGAFLSTLVGPVTAAQVSFGQTRL